MSRFGLRVPVWTETSVAGVYGRDRVEGVLVRGPGGSERSVAVDTVVFTGDFIPDSELARLAGVSIDPGTRGPACTAEGVTTAPGSSRPAMSCTRPRSQMWPHGGPGPSARLLRHGCATVQTPGPGTATAPVRVSDPLHWVVPNRTDPARAGGEPVLIRSRVFLDHPRVVVTQGGRLLASHRLRHMIPNRSHALPSGWQGRLRSDEDVLISVDARVKA